ncbi:hypothetical protein H5410_054819 [Solanum commersonii]|uniref:Ulp1 protease family, C-terminal catalytic domain containing protein n=1 Tax=Solanum commersonii TaxID=4109 RepID=A0A9J5WGV2_SOLCO|nr:hypothetical protein H5410_054819 [Solanum commersonii]
MSKKPVVTPQKSPQLVEGTSTDEVHAPSFNILTQTLPPKIVETLARGGSSLLKDQKEIKKTKQRKGDDMFIVKINGTKLHFGIKEFVAISGLKCGLLMDFVSDPSIPNRLITKYFGEMNKVPNTFITGSEASKTTIPKLYFDLVESECFRLTLKACSNRLGNNPTSFKFSQFHLALQIWFYECCHPFDNTVTIRVAYGTQRILNWKTSNESIFFDDLKNTIFRTYGNQDDAHQHVEESEKAPIDQPSVSLREYIDISNTDAMRINPNIICEAQNSIDQTVGGVFNADIPGSSTSKPQTLGDYQDLTMKQIIELDPIFNANTTPDVQPRNKNPKKYNTSPYIRLSEGESNLRRVLIFFRIKYPFERHNVFEVEAELIDEFNKWVFKDVLSRRGRKSAYSKIKDNFEPQMDFGVVKVSKKNFSNIMVKYRKPCEDGKAKYSPIPLSYNTVDCWFMTWVDNIEKHWRDSNCDIRSISPDHDVGQCIRGFKLLANISWDNVDDVIIPANISEKFHWFLVIFRIKLRCLHVYDSIRGGSVHTKKVNEVVVIMVCTCVYLLNASVMVFLICISVDIDVKHYRQRYATIIWHYGKTHNEDGAISESEVTGTIASKFGGPRITKEHVSDTTNYPIPRPHTRNLR